MQPLFLSATPSFHSPNQPHSLSRTSKRPSPITAPPSALHDNGTGSYPGNRPFISCVIKKMYFPRLFSVHFFFFYIFVDKLQLTRAVRAPSRSFTDLGFVRLSPLEYQRSRGATD